MSENTTKSIHLPTKQITCLQNTNHATKTTALAYDKVKRVVTTTDDWNTYKHYLDVSSQMDCIRMIYGEHATPSPQLSLQKTLEYIQQQLRIKRAGYRHQDQLKKLYTPDAFITEPEIGELLLRADFKCFYCDETVEVLYENVRHSKQWSLDRIDNTMGHNGNNVEIACLACNLRRRTMYHERYVATKKMRTVVKQGSTDKSI